MPTPRGRELREIYDNNLNHLYRVATEDMQLVHDAATTWLAIHPYVAAIVKLAQKDEGTQRGQAGSKSQNPSLTSKQFRACKSLFSRFREASQNAGFRTIMEQLEAEFDTYKDLKATEALEQLRGAPTRQSKDAE
ncbi:hypothetical protein [Paraburkholderia sp. EG304]|uniref:hypothetical protein n=1 Tax=Paraburkholderia sp. EG304 TaxID=3237015 RepID=UPI00397960A4